MFVLQVEQQLSCEDHGKDLTSVAALIKKHEALEQELNSREPQIDECRLTANSFLQKQHFSGAEMDANARNLADRFASLKEPCQIRSENLRDAHALFQWMKESDDECAWMAETAPRVASADVGANLETVKKLHKRHAALEQELAAREPTIDRLQSRGRTMVEQGHFAATLIADRMAMASAELDALKRDAAKRRQKLL